MESDSGARSSGSVDAALRFGSFSREPSAASLISRVVGDSDADPEDQDGGDRPKDETVKIDTRPAETLLGKDKLRSSALNDRRDVGNVGFFFGNWGMRARRADMRDNINAQIMKNPAHVVGIAECSLEVQEALRQPAVAGTEGVDGFHGRPTYEYLTIRGDEESSLLCAVRASVAESMELVFWEKKKDGKYKAKNGNYTNAYTRVMVSKITLRNHVGFWGSEMNVMVVHLHCQTANKAVGFRKTHQEFWDYLHKKVKEFSVDILMGDFNMSLFKVITEIRSRGTDVDLVAWFPWRDSAGTPMADSCGIFMLSHLASVKLCVGLESLHDDDANGLGWRAGGDSKYAVFPRNAGPGQPIDTYLPKTASISEKLLQSLTPTRTEDDLTSAAVEAKETSKSAVAAGLTEASAQSNEPARLFLKLREKRLDANVWLVDGDNHKGSHFPLCFFTNNVGRRSEERYIARSERRKEIVERQQQKQKAPQSRREQGTSQSRRSAPPSEGGASHSWEHRDWQDDTWNRGGWWWHSAGWGNQWSGWSQ